jgi:SAM-dependent methyltransferase
MGKRLLINPEAFIIHHAFKTGERVRGGPNKPGGWNSKEMVDRTNQWLIRKHGFKTYLSTMRGFNYESLGPSPDLEGDVVQGLVRGQKIVEVGCGFRKTVPQAIGIDRVAKGNPVNHVKGPVSVADIEADITQPIPIDDKSVDTIIARHILEHVIDPISTLRNWNRIIKTGGRLIIAVPNHEIRNTIPLNPEHVHGFTPSSLISLVRECGFRDVHTIDPKNGISFVTCFEKVSHFDGRKCLDTNPLEAVHA